MSDKEKQTNESYAPEGLKLRKLSADKRKDYVVEELPPREESAAERYPLGDQIGSICERLHNEGESENVWLNKAILVWMISNQGEENVKKMVEMAKLYQGHKRLCDFVSESVQSEQANSKRTQALNNIDQQVQEMVPVVNQVIEAMSQQGGLVEKVCLMNSGYKRNGRAIEGDGSIDRILRQNSFLIQALLDEPFSQISDRYELLRSITDREADAQDLQTSINVFARNTISYIFENENAVEQAGRIWEMWKGDEEELPSDWSEMEEVFQQNLRNRNDQAQRVLDSITQKISAKRKLENRLEESEERWNKVFSQYGQLRAFLDGIPERSDVEMSMLLEELSSAGIDVSTDNLDPERLKRIGLGQVICNALIRRSNSDIRDNEIGEETFTQDGFVDAINKVQERKREMALAFLAANGIKLTTEEPGLPSAIMAKLDDELYSADEVTIKVGEGAIKALLPDAKLENGQVNFELAGNWRERRELYNQAAQEIICATIMGLQRYVHSGGYLHYRDKAWMIRGSIKREPDHFQMLEVRGEELQVTGYQRDMPPAATLKESYKVKWRVVENGIKTSLGSVVPEAVLGDKRYPLLGNDRRSGVIDYHKMGEIMSGQQVEINKENMQSPPIYATRILVALVMEQRQRTEENQS